jgi:hypothetical protein
MRLPARTAVRAAKALAIAALALLVFMMQQRRLIVACGILAVLANACPTVAGARRRWLAPVTVAAFLAIGFGLSNTWRTIGDASATEHLTRTTTRFAEAPIVGIASVRERLAYLWIDGMAVQYGDRLDLSIYDALVAEVAINVPHALYPEKFSVPKADCETSFRPLGFRVDLPCTATAEGYLALGPFGVMLLAASWGLVLGAAGYFAAHGRATARLAGFYVFAHFIDIETGAFPVVRGLRVLLLLALPVAAAVLIVQRLRAGSARGPGPGDAAGDVSDQEWIAPRLRSVAERGVEGAAGADVVMPRDGMARAHDERAGIVRRLVHGQEDVQLSERSLLPDVPFVGDGPRAR